MTTPRDDDALTWDGDDDPTLDIGAPAAGESEPAPESEASEQTPAHELAAVELPDGFTAVGRGSETFSPSSTDDEASRPVAAGEAPAEAPARPPMGNGALIAFGVLGGVYALYAIGWLLGGLRLQGAATYLVFDVMYQGSLWLAVLAPVLWFVTTFLLTRRSRPWVRFAWLAAGVVVLLPWPFVMIGVVGQ